MMLNGEFFSNNSVFKKNGIMDRAQNLNGAQWGVLLK
jgi:hypothetical protein